MCTHVLVCARACVCVCLFVCPTPARQVQVEMAFQSESRTDGFWPNPIQMVDMVVLAEASTWNSFPAWYATQGTSASLINIDAHWCTLFVTCVCLHEHMSTQPMTDSTVQPHLQNPHRLAQMRAHNTSRSVVAASFDRESSVNSSKESTCHKSPCPRTVCWR